MTSCVQDVMGSISILVAVSLGIGIYLINVEAAPKMYKLVRYEAGTSCVRVQELYRLGARNEVSERFMKTYKD